MRRRSSLGESGNSARGVVPPVEVVERDVELVDAGVPERLRALGVSMPPCVISVMYLSAIAAIDRGDDVLEVAAQQSARRR